MKEKKSASILKKFLLFNLFVFLVLGVFTIIYLEAVQPNLVKKRTANHLLIIKNTSDHLERLKISFNKEGITQFLLSTRFLFQSLDRVQFYNTNGVLIGDTNILDLDQSVFTKSDLVLEQNIDAKSVVNFTLKTPKDRPCVSPVCQNTPLATESTRRLLTPCTN